MGKLSAENRRESTKVRDEEVRRMYRDILHGLGELAGAGIYEIHYNRYTNELYLVNGGFRPSTAAAAAASTQGTATAEFKL